MSTLLAPSEPPQAPASTDARSAMVRVFNNLLFIVQPFLLLRKKRLIAGGRSFSLPARAPVNRLT
jgi:hypothetical protein